jgi:hypothetical protein
MTSDIKQSTPLLSSIRYHPQNASLGSDEGERMPTGKSPSIFVFVLTAIVSLASAAYAGAPLKGVDVKLGKNPGGSPAARTTNADGKIDLGVLSAGSYYLIVDAPKSADVNKEPDAQIEIHGANGGTIKKRWSYAQKKAFDVTADATARTGGEEKILFTSDGGHPVEIAATAVVRSKSNISNN